MKIVFFGSGHSMPEPDRRCSCTMIEVNGRYYFIDMGMMAIEELVKRGIPLSCVKGIFVSHMHGDHTSGLFSWYFREADPAVYLPVIEAAEFINGWLALNHSGCKLHCEEIESGTFFDDGVLRVTAIQTQHTKKSYAFLVEAEGKRVLFAGDLKQPEVDFPDVGREQEINLVIGEAAHFPATAYETVLRKYQIKKVCINHFVPEHISSIQQMAKCVADLPVVTAYDGLEILV